jgi:hypothetical protein
MCPDDDPNIRLSGWIDFQRGGTLDDTLEFKSLNFHKDLIAEELNQLEVTDKEIIEGIRDTCYMLLEKEDNEFLDNRIEEQKIILKNLHHCVDCTNEEIKRIENKIKELNDKKVYLR